MDACHAQHAEVTDAYQAQFDMSEQQFERMVADCAERMALPIDSDSSPTAAYVQLTELADDIGAEFGQCVRDRRDILLRARLAEIDP